MVGGPGFEPGASRSRNLSGFVHEDPGQFTETVFNGFGFISRPRQEIKGRFHPPMSTELLHELLHD
jgi:hypothetical protein